jgi:DNA repair ATPase RecN
MDDKLKDFCKNYEVKVVNDNGRYARYRPPTFFTDPARADIIRNDLIEYQTEKLYTLQIPESRLQTLVEMEKRFYNHRNSEGMRDMFEVLMDKEREESYYRHTNEAVKKAYEQYSLMLNLAGYQRKF